MIGTDGASHSHGDIFFTSTRGGKFSTKEKPTFQDDIEYFQFLYLILTSLAFQRAGPRKNRGPDAKVIGVSAHAIPTETFPP